MLFNDRQLMELTIETRFTHDANGRIGRENEPGGERAPRFVFARTPVGNLWRVRDDLGADAAQQLDALAAVEPVQSDIRAAPANLAAFQRVLARDTPRVAEDVDSGPNYRFPDDIPVLDGTLAITYDNRAVLRDWVSDFATFTTEFAGRQPRRAVLVDGMVASVCWSARLGNRAADAGVETEAAFRGRGYALAVVAAWARDVRASGRIPLYGTSWANTASQAVARKLGLVAYGSMWTFM